MKAIRMATLAVLLVASQAACNDEKVLYEAKSEKPIPPVSMGMSPHGAPAASATGLPAIPQAAEFAAPDDKTGWQEDELAGLIVLIPAGYQRKSEAGAMRLAEYTVPPLAEGGDAGELVVFHFGAGQGGAAIDNAVRWFRQFKPGDDASTLVKFEKDPDVNGLPVTRLVVQGVYTPAAMSMGGAAPAPRPGWGLDGLIIEGGPKGSVFLRLTGPIELVSRESARMTEIAGSARPGAEAAAAAMPEPTRTQEDTSGASAPPAGPSRVLAGVAVQLPAGWTDNQPSAPAPGFGRMRIGEYTMPALDAGGQPGEVIVFHFGPNGAGSADDNLSRWASQVASPGDKEPERGDRKNPAGFNVKFVYTEGVYTPVGMGMNAAPSKPLEDQALHGQIVEGGPGGPLYIRATGPAALIRARRAELEAFVDGMKPE